MIQHDHSIAFTTFEYKKNFEVASPSLIQIIIKWKNS